MFFLSLENIKSAKKYITEYIIANNANVNFNDIRAEIKRAKGITLTNADFFSFQTFL